MEDAKGVEEGKVLIKKLGGRGREIPPNRVQSFSPSLPTCRSPPIEKETMTPGYVSGVQGRDRDFCLY